MNKLLITSILLMLFLSTGYSWPFIKKQPKVQEQQQVVKEEPKKPTISEGRNIVKEIKAELVSAKEENTKLKTSLANAQAKLKQSEERTVEVQKSADALKEWGIIQQAEAQKFMEKYNAAVKRYHRLKIIAAVIAAGVGVLLGLQFMKLAPPPYNLGVPFGGALLFSSLVWFLL